MTNYDEKLTKGTGVHVRYINPGFATKYHYRSLLPGDSITVSVDPDVPPPAGNPSGQPMPVGDLPGWVQVFSDDFTNDTPLGSFPANGTPRWYVYPYPWSTLGGYYDPVRVLSIHDSTLDLYLHNEGGRWLMAALGPFLTPGVNGQLYGRYAIRFKADALPGYYGVPLLWPKSESWPRDGEIDFPEGDLRGKIGAFMHRQGATSGGDQDGFSTAVPFAGAWHTAVTEWSPTACRFILDGTVIGTATSRIPNTPMRWVLQFTTSPSGLPPAGTAGHVLVDWVSVWRYAP